MLVKTTSPHLGLLERAIDWQFAAWCFQTSCFKGQLNDWVLEFIYCFVFCSSKGEDTLIAVTFKKIGIKPKKTFWT